jgi:hypothetical protein
MAERRFEVDQNKDLIGKRKRIRNDERRKATMKWIGIIMLIAVIAIVLINVIPPLFKKLEIIDTTYRPRDVERQYHQIQKLRDPKGGDPSKGGGS